MTIGPRAKKHVFRLVIVLVALGGCELATRVFFAVIVGPRMLAYGFVAPGRETRNLAGPAMRVFSLHHSPDPERVPAGYEKFSPGAVLHDEDANGESFSYTINEHGFRGPAWTKEKPPGTIRIVTLGASSTFGYHDRDDETYPHYLEELLNSGAAGEVTFEVLNLGMPHMTSARIVALFLEEALPFDPDVVTFYQGMNDAGFGTELVFSKRTHRAVGASLAEQLLRPTRGWLLSVAFVESVLYFATIIEPHGAEDVSILASENVPRFISNVARIETACRERGIVFVVATQQGRATSHFRVGGDVVGDAGEVTYAEEVALLRAKLDSRGRVARRELAFLVHVQIMDALRAWALEHGVPLADVITALDGDRDTLLSWVHLSPRGNRIVARTFAEAIARALPPAVAPTLPPVVP